MSPLSSKQKLIIGLYVGALTMVILLLWSYFLKFEFKNTLSQKSKEATWFNQVKREFGELASSSKNFLEQAKKKWPQTADISSASSSQATTTGSSAVQQLLLDQAKQQLEKKNK